MEYINNVLKTDFKETTFDFPIKEVVRYRGIYIVLISPLDNLEYPLNVYGVNSEGDIMWKIKSFNGEQVIFDKIEVNMNNGKLYLKDINHFKYLIDVETGEIISGKMRPLEDEPVETKNQSNKLQKISKTSKSLLDKTEGLNPKVIVVVFLIIAIFILVKLMGKSIEINSLNKKIETQQAQIEEYEQVIMIQEQKIEAYENLIMNLKTATQQIEQQSGIQSSSSVETIDNTQEQTVEQSRTENVNNGVSAVVDLIDSIIGNVASGTPTTIEDVNKPKVTNGYTVQSIIDGQRMVVSDGETSTTVKLISVTECKKETLEALFPVGTPIYLETDSRKYNDAGELLVYAWATEPNPNNLSNMANYVILKNGYGKFEIESPNIKYNRYFF